MKRIAFFALAFLTFISTSQASHVPGGNITYECVGPNQYLLTLTLFEDCGTAFTSNTNQTIQIANDCGCTSLTSISMPNLVFQQDPAERNDYLVDLARYFEGDPIVSVVWLSEPGLLITPGDANDIQAVVWVEGGTDKVNYDVSVILTSARNRRKKVRFLVAINEE